MSCLTNCNLELLLGERTISTSLQKKSFKTHSLSDTSSLQLNSNQEAFVLPKPTLMDYGHFHELTRCRMCCVLSSDQWPGPRGGLPGEFPACLWGVGIAQYYTGDRGVFLPVSATGRVHAGLYSEWISLHQWLSVWRRGPGWETFRNCILFSLYLHFKIDTH